MLATVDLDHSGRSSAMPRYLVERDFPAGLPIGADSDGFDACREVVRRNAEDGVTWVHSYVTADRRSTYCIYDAPTPGRYAAWRREIACPSRGSSRVRDLSPYFHR
jgi:hypothetical protein